jgi:hypothetical protein
MWRLMQTCIVFAVLASNVYYQWTPNPYLAGMIAFFCAFLATAALSAALDRRHLGRRQLTTQRGR